MKKFLLLLLTVSLFSCSGDDSSDINEQSSCINPPDWLQGTWVKFAANSTTEIDDSFTFTSDNIIEVDDTVLTTNWKEIYCNELSPTTINEEFSNNYYHLTFTHNQIGTTVTTHVYFIKESGTTMREAHSLQGEGELYHFEN